MVCQATRMIQTAACCTADSTNCFGGSKHNTQTSIFDSPEMPQQRQVRQQASIRMFMQKQCFHSCTASQPASQPAVLTCVR
jgi:hypothetical protein